jgi:hypothetical protein
LDFEIHLGVSSYNTSSNSSSTHVLTLSPFTPLASTSGRTVVAKLLGDLAGYTQLPVLRWGCDSEGSNVGVTRVQVGV